MDLLNIKPNVVSKSVAGKYFLFYGEPSTRKTSVAAMFPKPLLLATEIGYSLIPGVHAANIGSWVEFRDVVRQLKTPEVHAAYQTIVIDTVGLLTDMCMKFVCDKAGVQNLSDIKWGQGWTEFKKEFRTQLNTIAQLGYGIVLIAHSDTKKDNETGQITSALPMMDKKPRESVMALVDFMFYLQKEPSDNNKDLITVYAYSKLATIETKTRARHLNPRFEFNFENLQKEVVSAIEKAAAEAGLETVTEKVINHYASDGEPFEELKASTLKLAAELTFNGVDDATLTDAQREIKVEATNHILTIMKNVRVSLATAANYDQLATLKEALIELRDSI